MQIVPGSEELYSVTTIAMCVFSRLLGSSVVPRMGFVPVVAYLLLMGFFVIGDIVDGRRTREVALQIVFVMVPASVMALWIAYW